MDVLEAIRASALKSVLDGDADYQLRVIFRWYSREFYTPLAEVEDLPLDEVLTAYWECRYEEMQEKRPDQLEAERRTMVETAEERTERLRAADEEEADEKAFAKASVETPAPKSLEQLPMPAPKPELFKANWAESSLPVAQMKELPPDIQMVFVDESAFDEEAEGFGLMNQPGKQS